MNVFWETVTSPLLDILKPKTIVEIGVKRGKNTKNLLEYCRQNEAVLHAIDPLPEVDEYAWQQQYGGHLIFHRSLSLGALPHIRSMDMVLIDGDHNWYTVFTELKLIEKHAENEKRAFPLVLLHDVGWPYGRRDLYYGPENIPADFRKPYQKKGMTPDSTELMPSGGLNSNLNNAIYEHTPQNGVCTAVEDFMKETDLQLEFVTLPAYHGLGLLFLSGLRQHPGYSQFVDLLTAAHPLLKMLDQIEKTRILQAVEKVELNIKERELESDLRNKSNTIHKLQEELLSSEKRFDSYCEKVGRQQLQCVLLLNLEQGITQLLENPRWKIGCFLAFFRQWKRIKPGSIASMEQIFQKLLSWQPDPGQVESEINRFNNWIGELEKHFNKLISSKRWKMGNRVASFANRLLGRRYVNPEPQQVRSVRELFIRWKRLTGYKARRSYADVSGFISPEEAMGEPYTLRPPI